MGRGPVLGQTASGCGNDETTNGRRQRVKSSYLLHRPLPPPVPHIYPTPLVCRADFFSQVLRRTSFRQHNPYAANGLALSRRGPRASCRSSLGNPVSVPPVSCWHTPTCYISSWWGEVGKKYDEFEPPHPPPSPAPPPGSIAHPSNRLLQLENRCRARLGNGGVGGASADANSRVIAVLAQMGVEGALQLPNGSIRLPDGRVVGNFGLDGEGSGADASASTASGGGGGGGGGRGVYTSVVLRGVPSNVRMMVQGLEGEVRGVKKKLKVSRGWLR